MGLIFGMNKTLTFTNGKQPENKMEHEIETNIDNTDLIRQVYALTHEATVGNDPAVRLKLEELYKEAELRGVM